MLAPVVPASSFSRGDDHPGAPMLSTLSAHGAAQGDPSSVQRYRYNEHGTEQVAEFCDDHLHLSGVFRSVSSSGYGEYQDRLRAIQLHQQGRSKAEIARALNRSEGFVARWWNLDVREIPRPQGVHQYLVQGMAADTQYDKKELWQDVEIVRGFAGPDTQGIYEEILRSSSWNSQVSETKDFRTGSYYLRYDHEGKLKMSGMQTGGYEPGTVPRLDAILQRLFEKYGLAHEPPHVGLYWFSAGDAGVGSHRHQRCSARLAFGAERIMMVDKTPVLMRDGDLVTIGPQRHGIPRMPDVEEGSLRVSFQFWPRETARTQQEAKGSAGPSRAGDWRRARSSTRSEHEAHPGEPEEPEELEGTGALAQLMALGFPRADAWSALAACGEDVELAADMLLGGQVGGALASDWLPSGGPGSLDGWQELDAPVLSSGEGQQDEGDEALARRLQLAELGQGAVDEGLPEQFAEYDRMLDRQEVEATWDGYGDLMHNGARRKLLTISNLGPQTLFSLGTGMLTEKNFFGLLASHSVRVLYDLRAYDRTEEVRSSQPHFEVRALKVACRARLLTYRHVAVGREAAYGILRHLKSDEVQHLLVELVWRAKHTGHTAFLGQDPDWRADHRLVVAEELVQHGHRVVHLSAATGKAAEPHEAGTALPDWILQEESRLRKLDAMRKAGEFQRPTKSSVDRSTQAVARTLAMEKAEVDVGAELRDAENQDQLRRAQRRMVRLKVAEDKAEMGLSKKKLSSMPAYLAAEAQEETARREAKKAAEHSTKEPRQEPDSPSLAGAAGSSPPTPTAQRSMPGAEASALSSSALSPQPPMASAGAALPSEPVVPELATPAVAPTLARAAEDETPDVAPAAARSRWRAEHSRRTQQHASSSCAAELSLAQDASPSPPKGTSGGAGVGAGTGHAVAPVPRRTRWAGGCRSQDFGAD